MQAAEVKGLKEKLAYRGVYLDKIQAYFIVLQ